MRVALAMAKTKVAPVKTMSIPRLELEAAKLGVRLADSIEKIHSYRIKQRHFLSDSRCVLSRLNSRNFNFVPFVAHRVSEILDLTKPEEWMFVRSKDNVADDATKEKEPDLEVSGSRWFSGPEFLRLPVEDWPIERFPHPTTYGEVSTHRHELAKNALSDHFINRIGSRFRSEWQRLVRVVSHVQRARERFSRVKRPGNEPLIVTELENAEKEIFRLVQQESFAESWERLIGGRHSADKPMQRSDETNGLALTSSPEERLLRLSSRDRTSKSSFSAKNRIVLPKRHEFVQLYLRFLHEKNHHMGIESTISEAREKVWIQTIRQALRATIASCQVCRNRRAKPEMPTMGMLHASRTAFEHKPFTFVGVDCFQGLLALSSKNDLVDFELALNFFCSLALLKKSEKIPVTNKFSKFLTKLSCEVFKLI